MLHPLRCCCLRRDTISSRVSASSTTQKRIARNSGNYSSIPSLHYSSYSSRQRFTQDIQDTIEEVVLLLCYPHWITHSIQTITTKTAAVHNCISTSHANDDISSHNQLQLKEKRKKERRNTHRITDCDKRTTMPSFTLQYIYYSL